MHKSGVLARARCGIVLPWLVIAPCLLAALPARAARGVTLAWNSAATNLVGYRIYYGTASRTYSNTVPVGLVTNVSISGLVEGTTYFFAATAIDNQGLESRFSSEAAYLVPTVAPNQPPTLDPIVNLTINVDSGPQTVALSGITSGGTNEIQTLVVTAGSSNPGLIPNPAVNYTTPHTTGTLTIAPAANTIGTANITVTVNDGQATNNTFSRSFTVTVNDPPTLSAISNQATPAGMTTAPIPFTVSDTETPASNLTVWATSSLPTLVPESSIHFDGNDSNRTVTITLPPGLTNDVRITIAVGDGSATATSSFWLSVAQARPAADTPPLISGIPDQAVVTNTATPPIPFTIYDPDLPASNLVVTAVSSTPTLVPLANIVIGGRDTNRTVTIRPAPGQSGSADITLWVSDGITNASTTFHVAVRTYATVTLLTNGLGNASPNLNNQRLRVGQTCSVTAIPRADQEFAGWTGSITSTAPRLTFVVRSNLVFQANFVPSPFLPIQGRYNGLFYEADQVRAYSAGAFTVYSGAHGVYSGRLQLGAKYYSFSSRLNLQCQGSNAIPRLRTNSLALQLWFGTGDQADQLLGRLTDGAWTANLVGDRAVFDARTNRAPWAGLYTLILPGEDGNPALPAGDGFGSLRVSTNGLAQFSGTLADGTKVSQSASVSRTGLWPFYVPLYSGQGSALSWLAFTNRPGDDLNGLMNWIRHTNMLSGYYRSGFTNQLQAVGSVYQPPLGATNHVLDLTNATVAFSGGNLSADFTNRISLGLSSRVSNLDSNRLSLSFSLASGTFQGSVSEPSTRKSRSFSGAVFQKLNRGHGLLLGTNQTSRVLVARDGP